MYVLLGLFFRSMYKFTIITACFNAEKTIARTMQSVQEQHYKNYEHLIIDGKSTDETLNIVQSFSNSNTRIISEKDEGIYDALNKGISLATGDIIGFLHADDFFADAEVLERIARQFEQTDADAVYANLIYQKPSGGIHRYWKSETYKQGLFLWGWMPAHPTLYIKTSVYKALGGFNTQFTSAADYELMLRYFHKHQINASYLPKVTVIMQTGGKSNASVKNRLIANAEDRKAWSVNNLKPYFFTLYLKPLRKVFQFIYLKPA